MKTIRTTKHWLVVALVAAILLGSATFALAQSGGPYDLTWNTIDGGGYTLSSGGSYSLGGTIGQPDAGDLTGGRYILGGGFWGGGKLLGVVYNVYLPLVLR